MEQTGKNNDYLSMCFILTFSEYKVQFLKQKYMSSTPDMDKIGLGTLLGQKDQYCTKTI